MENLCPLQLEELRDSKAQVIVRSYRKEHFSLLAGQGRVSGSHYEKRKWSWISDPSVSAFHVLEIQTYLVHVCLHLPEIIVIQHHTQFMGIQI